MHSRNKAMYSETLLLVYVVLRKERKTDARRGQRCGRRESRESEETQLRVRGAVCASGSSAGKGMGAYYAFLPRLRRPRATRRDARRSLSPSCTG